MIEFRHTNQTQDAYDEIFHGEAIHQMDSLFIWVCSLLKIRPGTRLLDIATGRAQMVKYANRFGAWAVGMDFSIVACEKAIRNQMGDVCCSDAMNLPFPDQWFDFVTNIGSLEHFENMDMGLSEMMRVLKPGGLAVVMVPNTFGLRWNVMGAWRTGDVSDDGQPLQRYASRKQWIHLLERNHFKVIRVLGYEHERAFPKTWHDFFKYCRQPGRLFSMLFVTRFIPVNAAGQFLFLCQS